MWARAELPLHISRGVPDTPVASPRRSCELALKRGLDVIAAALALLLLSPLLIVIAVAIGVTSPGPVLFRQQRLKRFGQPFRILKFRTMYVDRCDLTGIAQTVSGDARVTPVGRMLRRCNLDELPQLINVLAGDMSIVGPRPHVPGMLAGGCCYQALVPHYRQRQLMRPGITGWAQANGLRGPTDDADRARARIDSDIAYLQNFSLLLDLRIVLQTLWRECGGGTGC